MTKNKTQQQPNKTNTLATAARLTRFILKIDPKRFVWVCIFITLSALARIAGALYLMVLVDNFIVPLLSQAIPDFFPLLILVICMSGIYLIGIMATFIYNRLMITISQEAIHRIRNEMFHNMQYLPIKYFDTKSYGEIMSLYTNDVDAMANMIAQTIPEFIASFVSTVAVLIVMLVMSPLFTAIIAVFTALIVFIAFTIVKRSKTHFGAQQQRIGELNGFVEEMIEGQKVIKMFSRETESVESFKVYNDKLCESATKANIIANSVMPVITNLGNIQYVLLAIAGGLLTIYGISGLTIGGLLAFLQLSRMLTMPLAQVSQQINFIIMALVGAERIFKLNDEIAEKDEGYVKLANIGHDANGKIMESTAWTGEWAWKHPHQKEGTVTYQKLLGDVEFENVSFSYDGEKTVLHEIYLHAKPGQKIAFVGATGAGKTTITNLINRFYDIDKGKIRYDGINILKIKKEDLRQSLGVVLQDTHLFTGTIMENIRYGKLDATDEEVYAAAKLARADAFIELMPNEYNTVLSGTESGISQGQRQLLSIARTAVANPPVLILDEATSSIDSRTETLVQAGMDALMHDRTVFVIAHRLSTIKNSDLILLLDNGRIVERGNHDELIAQKGKYYQLYTGAFELE